MTKADIDLAHKLVGELGHCARAMDQYGNGRIGGVIRAAASLLEKMVEENERSQTALGRLINDSMYKDHPEASQMAIDALKAGGVDHG